MMLDHAETPLVELDNISISFGGIKAVDAQGNDLGSHQAFWFAWAQFYPETQLWNG